MGLKLEHSGPMGCEYKIKEVRWWSTVVGGQWSKIRGSREDGGVLGCRRAVVVRLQEGCGLGRLFARVVVKQRR